LGHSALRLLVGLLHQPRVIMMMENWWNDDWQGKQKYSEKTCPSAALFTTNTTCCPDANPGRHGGKPATNHLSYDTAPLSVILDWIVPSNFWALHACVGLSEQDNFRFHGHKQ
jgi:hypothetical protein